ncbi:hypothetical protein CPB85DRAFT_1301945 [Mucidula mucida]|nr:hypothetical protein CPB85DRAFT_1301945 [Mucidula mucida]
MLLVTFLVLLLAILTLNGTYAMDQYRCVCEGEAIGSSKTVALYKLTMWVQTFVTGLPDQPQDLLLRGGQPKGQRHLLYCAQKEHGFLQRVLQGGSGRISTYGNELFS